MTQVNIESYEKQRRMHEQESKMRESAKVREIVKGDDGPKRRPASAYAIKGPSRDEVENMIQRKLEQRRAQLGGGAPVAVAMRAPLDKKVVKSAVDVLAVAASKPIRPDLQTKLHKNICGDKDLMESFGEIVQNVLPSGFGNIWIKTGVQYGSIYMKTLNGCENAARTQEPQPNVGVERREETAEDSKDIEFTE
jgi:hypothetical protein